MLGQGGSVAEKIAPPVIRTSLKREPHYEGLCHTVLEDVLYFKPLSPLAAILICVELVFQRQCFFSDRGAYFTFASYPNLMNISSAILHHCPT